jgi:hypothetical protein
MAPPQLSHQPFLKTKCPELESPGHFSFVLNGRSYFLRPFHHFLLFNPQSTMALVRERLGQQTWVIVESTQML